MLRGSVCKYACRVAIMVYIYTLSRTNYLMKSMPKIPHRCVPFICGCGQPYIPIPVSANVCVCACFRANALRGILRNNLKRTLTDGHVCACA